MDLALEDIFPVSRKGRAPVDLQEEYVRDLGEEDLVKLLAGESPAEPYAEHRLKKLRQSHHEVARLMADGVKETEISLITGYSNSRLSILKHDPAFKELCAYYAEQKAQTFINVHERLKSVGLDTLEELHDRLSEAPEKFSTKELQDLLALTLDRAGFGPKSTIDHKHQGLIVVADLIEAVKSEIASKNGNTVSQIRPQDHRGTDPRPEALGAAEVHTLPTPPRQQSGGQEL